MSGRLNSRLIKLERQYPKRSLDTAEAAESALRVTILATLAPEELDALQDDMLRLQAGISFEPSSGVLASLATYNRRLVEFKTSGELVVNGWHVMS